MGVHSSAPPVTVKEVMDRLSRLDPDAPCIDAWDQTPLRFEVDDDDAVQFFGHNDTMTELGHDPFT